MLTRGACGGGEGRRRQEEENGSAAGAKYAAGTLRADRAAKKAFSGSVELAFMRRRGGSAIISKGGVLSRSRTQHFSTRFSVATACPRVLLAIWGRETFGASMGSKYRSAIVTSALGFVRNSSRRMPLRRSSWSCRLSRRHARRDRQTQFLPGNGRASDERWLPCQLMIGK